MTSLVCAVLSPGEVHLGKGPAVPGREGNTAACARTGAFAARRAGIRLVPALVASLFVSQRLFCRRSVP